MPFTWTPDILIAGASVLVLILVNAALGAWRAFVTGEFDLVKLPNFLRDYILFDAGPLIILLAFAPLHAGIRVLFFASVVFLDVKYLAKITEKLKSGGQIE